MVALRDFRRIAGEVDKLEVLENLEPGFEGLGGHVLKQRSVTFPYHFIADIELRQVLS